MNKLAAALPVLAIAGTMEGCEPQPEVDPEIELTDPELDRQMTCTREKFNAVAYGTPLGQYRWAEQNCPGFYEEVKRLMETENPLITLKEVRDKILWDAHVDRRTVRWNKPRDLDATKMEARRDAKWVQEARRRGKVKHRF